MRSFTIVALNPLSITDPALPVAAARAGGLGMLSIDRGSPHDRVLEDIARATWHVAGNLGIRIGHAPSRTAVTALSTLPVSFPDVAIVARVFLESTEIRRLLWGQRRKIWVEVASVDEAREAAAAGASGLIAKGNEAGGWVGEETTFILLQRLLESFELPVIAYGGIGLHSAAACYAAGAAGVVLDLQLALLKESVLPPAVRAAIASMDGSETTTWGVTAGERCRVYAKNRVTASDSPGETDYLSAGDSALASRDEWRAAVDAAFGWRDTGSVWPIGQDAAFAAAFLKRFHTVGSAVTAVMASIRNHVESAGRTQPLNAESPLAASHGTRYPIVQGAMTRVSDRAAFARAVADGGALPFLALAQMRAPEVGELLANTRDMLEERPWGVGILGFVPPELRDEQLKVVREFRPRFALIAGGRPDQAQALEADGIATYLHVPSPELLRMFLQEGARRFVFEGRECGGHVGPRSSFVLWDSMMEVLLDFFGTKNASECHVLFAGGIHDARSAAMVAALSSPLAERGTRIGALVGTAYLFTREAVESGAIVPDFQRASLECRETVLLEVSPGHAIRCFPNDYVAEFERAKRELIEAGKSREEIREALEMLNLGRLRIASKGIRRVTQNESSNSESAFTPVTEDEARAEGMYMLGQVAAMRRQVTSIASLHSSIAVEGTRLIVEAAGTITTAERDRPRRAQPVAIVGMSCILPKAPDLESYWQNILKKVSAITEVPPDRWDWRVYFDESREARDKIYSRWGGFVDAIPFDPLDFGMPPASVTSTDPLQLLALKATRDAIDDAGYADRSVDRSRASVIIATSGGIGELGTLYGIRSTLPLLFGDRAGEIIDRSGTTLPEWTEDSFPGLLPNVIAGRIANRFNFTGTNFAIDAACGSSLAAIHMAVRELESRTSDMVIVGGVDNTNGPFGYLSFSKTHALSPTGACRTFDASADGIAISEGLVMLVLKRLEDAERDGDRIYAVVRGVGASSDGKAKGLTAPRPEGQALALERAYDAAGFSPATVSLFEAHGTGTVVGDRTEATTLSRFLADEGARAGSAAIGSVKSMIGHTKAAAGMAGIAKAALALYRKVLPPTLGVSAPNRDAGFGEGPLYINSESRPWIHTSQDHPRRAGVSAFGFGGTNFHAVLEEYKGDLAETSSGTECWPAELFFWSEPTRDKLLRELDSLRASLDGGAAPALRDLAFTVCDHASARRASGNAELAIVATSLDDLEAKLGEARGALAAGTPTDERRGIYHTTNPLRGEGALAFIFPGQGSQYPDMLRDVAVHFSVVRRAIERGDEVLSSRLPRPLSEFIYPPPAFTPEAVSDARRALTATQIAQPALGAVEVGLLELLRGLGVDPELAAGHSYGEYVALHAAGAIDEATLFQLSEARGRVIAECAGENPGTMAAAAANHEVVERAIASLEGVWIANVNGPEQTILAGTREGIEAATHVLGARGIAVKELLVSCAFHSPLVAEARSRFAEELASVDFAAPRIPVFSNTTGEAYPATEAETVDLLARHIVMPVRFQRQVEAMYEAGARVFIEVGPGNVLTGLLHQILGERQHLAVAVDAPGSAGVLGLLKLLAQLAANGFSVKFSRLFEGGRARRLDLAKLVEQTSPRPRSATTWMVDAARAWPAAHPRVLPGPAPLAAWAAAKSSLGAPADSLIDSTGAAADANLDSISARTVAAIEAATNHADAGSVLLEFQRVMNRALEVQENVMMTYLDRGHLPIGRGTSDSALAAAKEIASATAPAAIQPAESQATHPRIATTVEHLLARLLEIVSERTGYPTESLGLDVDLEGDLGIDSIKRTEIVGALRKSVVKGGASPRSMDDLTRAKTLRAIAEALAGALAASAEAKSLVRTVETTAPAAPSASLLTGGSREARKKSSKPLARSALAAVPAPLVATPDTSLPSDRVFLITDDEKGIAEGVAAGIVAHGGTAVILRGNIPGADSADVEVKRIRESHGRIAGIVHLLPLRDLPSFGMESFADWSTRLERETKALFRLVRATGNDLKSHRNESFSRIIAAAFMGGKWALDSTADGESKADFFPGSGAIAGLMKTVAAEWPMIGCKAIDFAAAAQVDDIAARILDEMCSPADDVQIGYMGRRRYAARHVSLKSAGRGDRRPRRRDPSADRHPITRESVILATGGACGIAAEILVDLARSVGGGTFVVTGRSPAPAENEAADTGGLVNPPALKNALMTRLRRGGESPALGAVERAFRSLLREREIRRNLARLRSAGANAVYVQSDASDPTAVASLVDRVYADFGRLDGVIHAAGVIDDHLIEDKTSASFDSVFDVKAHGGFALATALKDRQPREFLAFFSSTAAAFGNRGQCDYSAANEVLNKLAAYLDARWTTRVFAIGWGPWSGAGMVSPELERQLRERGTPLIDVGSGTAAFRSELFAGSKGCTQLLFVGERQAAVIRRGAEANATGNGAHRSPGETAQGTVAEAHRESDSVADRRDTASAAGDSSTPGA